MDLMLDINTSIYPLQVACCILTSPDCTYSADLRSQPVANPKQYVIVAQSEIREFSCQAHGLQTASAVEVWSIQTSWQGRLSSNDPCL